MKQIAHVIIKSKPYPLNPSDILMYGLHCFDRKFIF